MTNATPHIEFIVGEEKRLADIVGRSEVEPLLRSALDLGVSRAALLDEDGLPVAQQGQTADAAMPEPEQIRRTILVEGEPQGTLVLEVAEQGPTVAAVARLLQDAVQLTVTNNLKRMLTTEVHTSVVQESYEQLVTTNRRLMESERRYRTLAQNLEKTVEERTAELRSANRKMAEQEKLAAVGQLAAGMAHEINTPLGFVRSNLNSFAKYQHRMAEMLGVYRLLLTSDADPATIRLQAEQRWKTLKLDLLLEDCGVLLGQSISGIDRIAAIVSQLKDFAHLDGTDKQPMDLNRELEQLLAGMASQFPPGTTLTTDLQPLPPVICHIPLMVQAFANLIDNALKSRSEGLELKLSTAVQEKNVLVRIEDNGCGIPSELQSRIFEPFFTTRQVGSGTGMGLTVAREAVVGAGGELTIVSAQSSGTTCTISLPISPNETKDH